MEPARIENSEVSSVTVEIRKHDLAAALVGVAILAASPDAPAYVGPGAGLSIVGSVLAFLAAIVAGILGFLWFPIRRMIRKRKEAAAKATGTADPTKTAGKT
ncbi:MAG TPA: hypothetical protein VGA24_05465 [Steroidobacteraceae bacterium]